VKKRKTFQRECIRQSIEMAQRPLSINEIYGVAKKEAPKLGIATVYRSIRALEEEGLVNRVDLPGRESRWELERNKHHHHFLCLNCDRLFEVEGCPGNLKHLLPKGYVLESHDILLSGQCKECSSNKFGASSPSVPS